MAVPDVNQRILSELTDMGFPQARATRALHFSGNSSVEAAVNWVVDHENDPEIDQMPLVPVDINIEDSESFKLTEHLKLIAQELRDQMCRKDKEEEKKLGRKRERERTKAGKELLEAKRVVEDDERKRFLALRKVEKEEERRARDKVRQKLQQDKVERRQRIELPVERASREKPTPPLMQEKGEPFPYKSSRLPSIATKTELMRDCLRSLKQNCVGNDAKTKRVFQTLFVYVRNVMNNPDEEKFRKIRFGNPVFQDRVAGLKEGIKFLELCGFERDETGKYLSLPRDKVDILVLKSAVDVLTSAVTNPYFALLSSKTED